MSSVSFHVNLADPIGYACRLLRKASAAGARVVVVAEPLQLRELDAALWTFSAPDFIAHAVAGAAPAAVLAHSPIVLSPQVQGTTHRQVLVNLSAEVPAGFEGFERLIELVGTDPESLAQARVRWKHYAGGGHPVTKHDQKEVA